MHMDGVGAIGEASSDLDRVITAKNGTTQSSMKYKSLRVYYQWEGQEAAFECSSRADVLLSSGERLY